MYKQIDAKYGSVGSPPPALQTGGSLGASLSVGSLGRSLGDASPKSPFGPLHNPSIRKSFGHLVALLNAAYPDYDFRYITTIITDPVYLVR